MSGSSEKGDTILVVDFGAQYAHLIARRIRECGVYSELVPYASDAGEIASKAPKGIVLSGGPASVKDQGAPTCDPRLFELGIPVLGICYGLQLTTHLLGGEVMRASKREYGRVELEIDDAADLFRGLGARIPVWMSHADTPVRLPDGFEAIAHTGSSPAAAVRNRERNIYGVQFHPEVAHTPNGLDILRNFLRHVCGCDFTWSMESFVERAVEEIKQRVGNDRVLCALSGGVDSSATAVLVHKAVGDQLTCIFVDTGLLRKNETKEVLQIFRDHFGMRVVFTDESKRFLYGLKGIADPEEKRGVIGREFIRVFTECSERLGPFDWLAQGTLYPDVIESARAGSPASRIKTHHNVGGLPEGMSFKLLEPLREMYKDEARKIAALLGLPDTIVSRHPFPGVGLAARIIGEVTEEKLQVCREASYILEEELRAAGIYSTVWQAFAMVGDDRAVGVLGDERRWGYIVTLRVVESVDAMTADWSRIPYPILEKISNRITNEVQGVTWVAYAVSSKPPATIEPQ